MKWQIIIVILLSASLVEAELQISQFVYDGEGADEGKEFIELENAGNETISLSNYSLEYYSGSEWNTIWNGECEYCFMKSESFYIIGEINQSDILVNLNLLNTKGSIRLNKEHLAIDLVGYGSINISQGLPAIDVESGKSVLRIDSTGNNFADFRESEIIIRNQKDNFVEIVVDNSVPEIINYSATKIEGVSKLTLEIEDLNGEEDLQTVEVNCTDELLSYPYSPTLGVTCDSQYSFRVKDSLSASEWVLVQSKELFEIISINGCNAIPGERCLIEIEAQANLNVDVELKLAGLYKGRKKLEIDEIESEIFLAGEIKTILLEFQIPIGTSAGNYQGELELIINS